MLESWTRAVLRLRLAVLALWLVVAVFGIWSAAKLPGLLSNSFAVPGTDSDRGRTILERHFGDRSDGRFVVVFRVSDVDRATRRRLVERLAKAADVVPTGRAGRLLTGGGVLYGTVDTALELKTAKRGS